MTKLMVVWLVGVSIFAGFGVATAAPPVLIKIDGDQQTSRPGRGDRHNASIQEDDGSAHGKR